jgi:hypothetical protein
MRLSEIKEILGGDVSTKNSKMPGTSFGLSTDFCQVGSALRGVVGSVCEKCYARRIEAFRPSVKKGWMNRTQAVLKATSSPCAADDWIEAMSERLTKLAPTHHRWHDSGDLLNYSHLLMIVSVAQLCPDIQFWLPTKEKGLVNRLMRDLKEQDAELPSNLNIRLSMPMVGMIPVDVVSGVTTSTVHKAGGHYVGHQCPAPDQGNKCGECRACWSKEVMNVSYRIH